MPPLPTASGDPALMSPELPPVSVEPLPVPFEPPRSEEGPDAGDLTD
jgi:hypothetical protein